MRTIDLIKWYKPIIVLILLHSGILLYCFNNTINTMLYSTIAIFFLALMLIEIARVNKTNRTSVFASILLAMSVLYLLFLNQIASMYLGFVFAFVVVVLMLFGGIQMIRKNAKTSLSEKNIYTLLWSFIIVVFALTTVLNMLNYKSILLLEMQEKYPLAF